jgi:hypothetical protein
VTPEDSIVRLAIALTFWEVPPDTSKPLVVRSEGFISAQALPNRDGVRYLFLADSTIRRISRRPGVFTVMSVTPFRSGDSARVHVGITQIGPFEPWDLSSGACEWVLYRDRRGWRTEIFARPACAWLHLIGPCFLEIPVIPIWPPPMPDIDAGFPVARSPIGF